MAVIVGHTDIKNLLLEKITDVHVTRIGNHCCMRVTVVDVDKLKFLGNIFDGDLNSPLFMAYT